MPLKNIVVQTSEKTSYDVSSIQTTFEVVHPRQALGFRTSAADYSVPYPLCKPMKLLNERGYYINVMYEDGEWLRQRGSSRACTTQWRS